MNLTVLSLRVPRESENTPEQTAQLLASLAKATAKGIHISLEVTLEAGQITFAAVFPTHLKTFVSSQLLATYPDVIMTEIKDYLQSWKPPVHLALIRQAYSSYFPLRDYADYKEVDPMLPLLGVFSKAKEGDRILVQFVLTPASTSIQKQAYSYLHPKPSSPEDKPVVEGKKLIEDKLSQPLVGVSTHLVVSRPELIHDLFGAISVLNRPDGNSLIIGRFFPWERNRFLSAVFSRQPFTPLFTRIPVLNVMELSSLWHLPGVYTKLPNVAWAPSSSFVEAPENLPVYITNISLQSPPKLGGETEHKRGGEVPASAGDANKDINFFAKTTFRNQETTFGIKLQDRLRHVYILGKSGTGKSTLLENMAVDDFKKGRGVAFIDPHGDACDNLLNYIPSSRINDVIYFNPADRDHPIALNILEVKNPEQAELVASGIVSIFHKLYGHSWGPRLEYILRNTLLTLTQIPDSTLPDVVKMLTDSAFRKKIYAQLKNQQLLDYWKNEFDRLEEKTRAEQISSILNKVGQFVSSSLIQNVIAHPKSTINLEDILNTGKILIANLSQGKLGEDNSALLGAMLITKLELAAMSRVDLVKAERKPFFLYVDEFQNFATESFIKILSEARKYGLGLTLANQYIAQIPEPIQKAIFGNAGTVIGFVMGSEDARVMEAEFGTKFTKEALVSLQKYQIAVRITIDSTISQPFLATSLPPLKSTNLNREKVLASSRSRWSKKISKS
ncbi:MAG: hypothetical protein G01um101416_747 [Microgenomates group bacterium Gr01-1014_16]|nr:MAG: hypothetical protein G01um101416_747 [Microgenomates group bacterium Gr01-1014_16]